MIVDVKQNGKITIITNIEMDTYKRRKLIKKIVDDDYKGEKKHKRWTTLYNAYDLVYETNIREEHEKYCKKYCETTRLDFIINTGLLDKLFYVAVKIYKVEFEEYIKNCVKL